MRNRIAIVDIATRKFKALSYKQYDANNILQIVVMENNKIVDISSYNATIYFKLPSEKTYRTIGIIKNNTINVTLSSSVLKEYGKVILEVKLSNGDEIVTTFSIYLNVEKSIDGTDSPDADDDPNLEDIYHTHNNKEVLDQITQEMIDTIVSGGGFVDLTNYQTKSDDTLTTTSKTVVGAINEVNTNVMMKANNTFEASMTTVSSLGGIPAGSDLNGLSLQQVLTKLLFPYIKPSVSASLTYSPSVSVYEYGQSISVSKINTNVTKKSENIVSIKFYQNNTLINTISSDCSNGGSFSHTFTSPITITSNISNSYFKVIINDGISDVTATTNSFTFVYPYYYGVIANDVEITEDLIKGLTKQVVTKGNKSYTYSPNFQKMVIAYPKSYGVLKSILDPNGFEQKASFTVTELNIIGLNGTSQAYYVYTNGASTNTNFTMQFKY